MYKTILVPLDGSQLAEQALPLAATLARAQDSKLIITRAVHLVNETASTFRTAQTEAMTKAETYLDGIALKLRVEGLTVETSVDYATPVDGILGEIDVSDVDLVVMTTHGRSGLSRLVYGSVAESVLTYSPVPVIMVRVATEEPVPIEVQPHPTLLVPLDGSAFAEEALPHAMAMAQALQAEIALLEVHVPPDLGEHDVYAKSGEIGARLTREQEHIEGYLSGLAHHVREMGLPVRSIIRAGDVVQTILEEGWTVGATMIVMATHGQSGMRRTLFGSTAFNVLRHSVLPVMLIRPKEFVSELDTKTKEAIPA